MTSSRLASLARHLGVLACALVIAACGGGASTTENPVTTPPSTIDYKGPPPASADIQAFRVNVWENLKASNRCGQCHGAGGQSPLFVRNDDVNQAYTAANVVANLNIPSNSRMVTKVGGGHHCWLTSNSACADQITAMITRWAGATVSGQRQIVLQAPAVREVGGSKSFPDSAAGFASTVHPLLTRYCSRCHVSGSATPQSPFFAEADPAVAYAAARARINLDSPEQSRLVVRLRDEFHNCWNNCPANAAEMLAAVQAFASGVPVTQVDPSWVVSKALSLYDGTVASGGNRNDGSVIALYEFKTGTGNVAYDTSGVEPSLNLALSGDISWVGGWGINIRGGKAQGSTASSRKIHDLVKATGEYTVEAWVAPANVVQEDAFIVSLSGGTTARNFTLAQDEYNYDFYARSTSTGANGTPVLSTPNAARIAQATLQHVAATYDPVNGRRLYVNGQLVNVSDPVAGGTLTDWNDTFALVLGNEVSGDRPFAGVLRLVAVHNRALSAAQVQQNFGAGVGERFYMLFGVSHLVSVPQSYVMFEVSQFDSYGYLFDKPAFISLDPAATPSSIRIRGMRIGMNGAEARAGQAYVPMDAVVNGSGYSASKGFPLSSIGTVVALDKGPALDAFFLTFEQIGSQSNPRTEPAPVAPPPPAEGPPVADIGLKTFEELDASMSVMTGVPRSLPEIAATYDRIQQQLPVEADIEGFLSSHQVGLAQLAIEYCNALVDDSTRRAQYFAGFDFAAPAAQAFDTAAERNLVIDPLVARAIGTGIATQPSAAEVRAELDSLITRLASCGLGCAADRTPTVVKSACSAVVGSAATLLQ